jgi:predicted ferric reductase
MYVTTPLNSDLSLGWYLPTPTQVRFRLQGSLTGWAGIGFERTGKPHTAMDTYVGWILSSGTAVLQDGYSTSFDIPTSDPSQSARIVSASQTASTYTLVFDRSLDSTDANDVAIRLGTTLKLTWAYHLELKPTSSSIDAYYPEHTHRGSRMITIKASSTTPSPTRRLIPSIAPSFATPTIVAPVPSQPPVVPTHPPLKNNSDSFSLTGDDNFYVTWKTTTSNIQFTYDCKVSGWVGIGFDKSSTIHRSTDTYISWVMTSGQGVVLNGYSDRKTQPINDNEQIANVLNASLVNNRLQLTFERPLQSTQSTDYSFTPGEWILMGWAYHPTDNPNTWPNSSITFLTHTARGSIYTNIYTGESKSQTTPFLPSTYYLLIMFAGFICFATFQRLKCNLTLKWFKEKSRLYPNYSNIECLIIGTIVCLNGLCIGLGIADQFTQLQIWGYMSTANSLIVAIPATRNSILTLISGISVDQTIMYHRWLGRLTILEACVHFGCAVSTTFSTQSLYGLIALVCGLTIGLTSIHWLRRNVFNFFFSMHHLFIVYYVMGSLHTPIFFKLTILGITLYLLDLILRLFRGLFPTKIIYSEQVHRRVIKVRFSKPPFCSTSKIGQYVFLNFPQVSLFEWHPFTLVNGPNDPYYEVYIKNLGDYTRELIWYFSNTKNPVWIRTDGPYGKWPFDYTQYSHLTFICGGVGITPCISFVRHVYQTETNSTLQHIYLVWCCTKETDAQWINEEFAETIENVNPKLHLYIFITDQQILKNTTFHAGRPDIQSIFNLMENQMTKETDQACVFACGPKSLTQQTWETWSNRKMEKHCVYHQEIFEF